MWLELGNPLTEKCLINISYCPHQSLGDFFLDELSAEVSNAFSATDNILLFGDYNIDMLSVNGQKSLQNFAAGLGLQLSNIDIPTRISNNKKSLIDHCFSSNKQITSCKVCLPPFDIDHNVIFFQSKLFLLEEKQFFFIRDTKNFVEEKFNRDLALADWRTVYQQRNCDEMFAEFNKIFLTILEKNAPTEKKLVSNIKKTTSEKPWMTKEIKHLVSEKHRYFNEYKLTQSAESFASFKKYRNLVNRKLKEAQNQFSEDFLRKLKPHKRNGNSLRKKLERKITVQTSLKLMRMVKKRKTKNQYVTLLTESSAKWASTEGRLFH